jgi:hypothetical protein
MNTRTITLQIIPLVFQVLFIPGTITAQEADIIPQDGVQRFFDGMVLEEEDDRVAEELQNILDDWLENPLCMNSDQAGLLAEYGLISTYQYHKLREYRMVTGDLLSVYELKNIDGWNTDLARKVAPYLSTINTGDPGMHASPSNPRINHQLVLKTSFNPQLRKGYQEQKDDSAVQRHYLGPAFRLGLRYDLSRGDRFEAGLRMEKDQGEPFLVNNRILNMEYQGIDHLSAFLKFNFRGLVRTVILGDYRVAFGYGLNYSGGRSPAGSIEGLAFPSHRARANTSMAESGYLRGACLVLQKGRIGFTGFASYNNLDGGSVKTDSLGHPESFTSVDNSGLHRSASEISRRKAITEQLYGGHLVFTNNWLKAGLISHYQRFDVPARAVDEAYGKFRFKGRSNLVTGMLFAAWLRKIRLAGEFSVSRNKGFAMIVGAEVIPMDGIFINVTYRKYGLSYQNLHGAGHFGGSQNDNTSEIEATLGIEAPARWLVSLRLTAARNRWASFGLNAPGREWVSLVSAEKSWRDKGAIYLSFKHRRETVVPSEVFSMLDSPVNSDTYNGRLECRYEIYGRIDFKTRIETCLYSLKDKQITTGWLVLQDIGYAPARLPIHLWLRIGYFESGSYDTRIYAYENDVLYDFSSFMHDGKGLRNVFLVKYSPCRWLDCWARISSIHYKDRPVISSGWDEVQSDHLQEVELQVRLKI